MKLDIDEAALRRWAEMEEGCCISAGITPNGLIAEMLAGNMIEAEARAMGERAGILEPLPSPPALRNPYSGEITPRDPYDVD